MKFTGAAVEDKNTKHALLMSNEEAEALLLMASENRDSNIPVVQDIARKIVLFLRSGGICYHDFRLNFCPHCGQKSPK